MFSSQPRVSAVRSTSARAPSPMGPTLQRIRAIMLKELRQLARDRPTFGMIIGIPLLQILLFGYAINFDVRQLRAAAVDEANTSYSRALLGDMQASDVVVFLRPSVGVADLRHRLDTGE